MTDSTGTYNFTVVDGPNPEFKTSEKSGFDRMLSVFRNSTVTFYDSCKKRRKSGTHEITRLNEMNLCIVIEGVISLGVPMYIYTPVKFT